MKIIASTVLVALFAVCQGRFLDATTASMPVSFTYGTTAFANTLNCGACVGLGHTYCIQKAENTVTNAYMTGSTQQTCIQSGSAGTQMVDATWSCTNAFANRAYSKYVCQYNTSPCGSITNFTLPAVNSTASVNITSLALGQTCFYKVLANCGAPAFKPNDTTKVEIEYVEFLDANLNSSDVVRTYTLTSNDTNKRGSVPATGMPRRDHYFNAELGGNNIANANITTYNSSTNGTLWGRSGRYDKSAPKLERKVYGNPVQSDSSLGNLTVSTNLDCQNRQLYVAVTAITDLASLKVDFSSVSFYRAPATSTTTGASFLSMTVAAVIGLISLAFF
jgi:hypothetical protein